MSRREKIDNQSIDKTLGLFGALSRPELEAAEERASRRFGSVTAGTSPVNSRFVAVEPGSEIAAVRGRRWRLAMVAASAAVFLAVIIGSFVWRQAGSFAVVETADGSVYRIVNGKTQATPVGERLDSGQTVRTNGGVSAVFKLADGSRVEMRAESELSLERVDDGARIHLSEGNIIVTAAKQPVGRHLYVQTKDVSVSVVGTVFLVNSEQEGSRVAVFEGDVHVERNGAQEALRSGEQLKTNPKMDPRPVSEEIAWSPHAEAHLALLQRSASTGSRGTVRAVFEEASIRLSVSRQLDGRGGNGGLSPCRGGNAEVDPRRFSIYDTTLYTLITMAYRIDACPNAATTGRLIGGAGWIGSDTWDIQAIIPEGAPAYTRQEFNSDRASTLDVMLQNLLSDRFGLVLRRDTKVLPAYVLKVGKNGLKLESSGSEVASTALGPRVRNGQASVGLNSNRITMSRLAGLLTVVTGSRPVLDQTGVNGEFKINLGFVPPDLGSPLVVKSLPLVGPSLFAALEDIGLQLEAIDAPLDVWVIDRVERPSEN